MLQFIYLFTYLTGFMKQGLIYATLGLNSDAFAFTAQVLEYEAYATILEQLPVPIFPMV